MKTYLIATIFLIAAATSAAYTQQSFIHTVTKANTNCNSVCSVFEAPELAGNPNAVVFITPVDELSTYRHPIGAYYMYLKKWSVFNLDNVSMVEGTRFNVEYYANADDQHFTYIAPQQVAHFGVGYIDHKGLDNNPVATVRMTPHISSLTNGAFDRSEAKVEYYPDIQKWVVANINGRALTPGNAYNIGFSPGASAIGRDPGKPINSTPRDRVPPEGTANTGGSTTNGNAGGDLSGTYPAPTVKGLLGRDLSNTAPQVGMTLRWSGSEWVPAFSTNVPEGQTVGPQPPPGPGPTPSFQTYFKTGILMTPAIGDAPGGPFPMSDLSHHIVTTRHSRFVIAGTIRIECTDSVIGFNNNKIRLEVFINGVSKMFVVSSIEAGAFNMETIGPFMIDEDAGTYDIVFKVQSVGGALYSHNVFARSNQSSVIVISSDNTGHVF